MGQEGIAGPVEGQSKGGTGWEQPSHCSRLKKQQLGAELLYDSIFNKSFSQFSSWDITPNPKTISNITVSRKKKIGAYKIVQLSPISWNNEMKTCKLLLI